jgi:hypothetical protein
VEEWFPLPEFLHCLREFWFRGVRRRTSSLGLLRSLVYFLSTYCEGPHVLKSERETVYTASF